MDRHVAGDIVVMSIFLILVLLIVFVIMPYVRLQMRRRESRGHMPQPEEIWQQDDGILYIDEVNTSGVILMSFDPDTKQFHKWKDTWGEWNERLKKRAVWYTGQRRPLGPVA